MSLLFINVLVLAQCRSCAFSGTDFCSAADDGYFLACDDFRGRSDDSFQPQLIIFLSGDQLALTVSTF